MKPGRYRRGPGRESEIRRRHSPAGRNARDVAAAMGRRQFVRHLEQGQRQQWGELYRRHEQERRKLSQAWGSLQGRVRQWRAQGKHWDELAGAIRGKSQVRAEWEQGIEWQNRRERAVLVRDHGLESRRVEQEWAAVDRRREQEAARGREPGPSQQQQERKPAKNNEEHFRKIADDPIKPSGPSVGPQRPEREQDAVAARQRAAEAARQREQEAARQREAERELMRQREAAAALERAEAAEKAKIARDRPAVVTVEEIVRAAGGGERGRGRGVAEREEGTRGTVERAEGEGGAGGGPPVGSEEGEGDSAARTVGTAEERGAGQAHHIGATGGGSGTATRAGQKGVGDVAA